MLGPPIFVLFAVSIMGRAVTAKKVNDYDIDNKQHFVSTLYKGLRNSTELSDNILVSPVCLQMLLALALEGAENETAAELASVLHHSGGRTDLRRAYKAWIKSLRDHKFRTAAKIFLEKKYLLNPTFNRISRKYFLSGVRKINFQGDPKGAMEEINHFIQGNTDHKLNGSFQEGDFNQFTKLVMANAAYFKAKWKYHFTSEESTYQDFAVSLTHAVKVKMMSIMGDFNYAKIDQLQAEYLEFPFQGDYRMSIFLPFNIKGFFDMETNLLTVEPSELISVLTTEKIPVRLELPKFRIDSRIDLQQILSKMGMPTAFSHEADFSKISKESLRIDNLVQRVFLEVDEEGTKATAGLTSSGFVPLERSRPGNSVLHFKCNHPFLFFIMKHSTVLFMGRLSNPDTAKEIDDLKKILKHLVIPAK